VHRLVRVLDDHCLIRVLTRLNFSLLGEAPHISRFANDHETAATPLMLASNPRVRWHTISIGRNSAQKADFNEGFSVSNRHIIISRPGLLILRFASQPFSLILFSLCGSLVPCCMQDALRQLVNYEGYRWYRLFRGEAEN
jgi:hypothetical protein